ncbi:transcription termination factor Rho [Fodinicurvata sp. EGI_FJ10296]|uniref:transcription termination factor Rho n=1 Tax=Fodinicurvata sp. EGI_FJ10296 TaxID=3231908 RepID=UPI0034520967
MYLDQITGKSDDELSALADAVNVDEWWRLERPEAIRQVIRNLFRHHDLKQLTVEGVLCEDDVGSDAKASASLRVTDRYGDGADIVQVPGELIRDCNLRAGDVLTGRLGAAPGPDGRFFMVAVTNVNGKPAWAAQRRRNFCHLTPIHPDRFLPLEYPGAGSPEVTRMVDLIAPQGKGQRTLIVAPPRSGKTMLLKEIANGVSYNHPRAMLIALLVDERPEEVTDFIENTQAEVCYSTFDSPPDEHIEVAEKTLAKAKRLVEFGRDVVVLIDSITRLTRAYNAMAPATGRVMSGGIEAISLQRAKKLFGAARNLREGGSLTVMATALVETGSRMDDLIYEEWKGTGNSEIVLDRRIAERQIWPALDMAKSETRQWSLLFDDQERKIRQALRTVTAAPGSMRGDTAPGSMTADLLEQIRSTRMNAELLARIGRRIEAGQGGDTEAGRPGARSVKTGGPGPMRRDRRIPRV